MPKLDYLTRKFTRVYSSALCVHPDLGPARSESLGCCLGMQSIPQDADRGRINLTRVWREYSFCTLPVLSLDEQGRVLEYRVPSQGQSMNLLPKVVEMG